MNRSERRRQARAEAKEQQKPVLILGDGIVASTLPGHRYEAKGRAELRPKVPGQHRWIASGAWILGDVDVERASDADHFSFLDQENLMHLAIGCWDCEQSLGSIAYGSSCPAGAAE